MSDMIQRIRNRKGIGGVPRGYEAPRMTTAKARESFREDGRLDAMDICYGEEPTREPLFIHVTKGGTRKPMTSKQIEAAYGKGYTPEVMEAAQYGYREGFERYMADYGCSHAEDYPEGSPGRERIEGICRRI